MTNYLKSLALCGMFFILNGCSSNGNDSTPASDQAVASITATVATATEPSLNGEFTIKLSKNVAEATMFTLKISGTATNGSDYKTISNYVTLPAKTAMVVIPVEVLADQLAELDETLEITLTATNNDKVMVGPTATATVTIKDGVAIIAVTPSNVKTYMVDKNATAETAALFYNLKNIAKTSFIIGQMDAMTGSYQLADASNLAETDMKKTVGYDPGMNGADFMFITDDQNDGTPSNWYKGQEKIIIDGVVKAYDRGMINTFSWHVREPYEGKFFNTNEMTPTAKANAFKSILVGGVNHEYLKKKLDKIADVFNNLKGADGKLIPVIFRPWHEFDGSWFWWGAAYCTPQEFIQNYQFTVTYLRDVKKVRNLLFAFSPDVTWTTEAEYLSRYPGDAYVDVLGLDDYGDFDNKGIKGVESANKRLQIISNLAKSRAKIAALTESSYIISKNAARPFITNLFTTNYYNALTTNGVEISYIGFWNNGKDSYSTPVAGSGSPYETDFLLFTKKEKAVLLNKLPNMYKMP